MRNDEIEDSQSGQRQFHASKDKSNYLIDNRGWLSDSSILKKIREQEYFKKIIKPRIHDKGVIEEVTIQTIDHAISILGRCNNPNKWEEGIKKTDWPVVNSKKYYQNKQGLCYGMVQSGKTASMITLMGLANSAGYNFLILLSSDKESLRVQTQDRLNKVFNLSEVGNFEQNISVIINDDDVYPDLDLNEDVKIQSFTKLTSDYSLNPTELLRKFRSGYTVVVCIKKNKIVLDKLLNDLRTFKENRLEDFQNIKSLIIDDEADYGSQNTKKSDLAPINELITNIRKIISKNCFVQYTATPQACIGADPSSLVGYPKDFIWLLKVYPEYGETDTYLGANEFFDKYYDSLCIPLSKKTWPHYVKDDNGKRKGVMDWTGELVKDENNKVDDKAKLPEIEEKALSKFLNDKRIRGDSCKDYKVAIIDFLITCSLRWYRSFKNSEANTIPSKEDIVREKKYTHHAMIFNLAFKTINHIKLQKLIKIIFKETKGHFYKIDLHNFDTNNLFNKQYNNQKTKSFKLKKEDIPSFKDLYPFIEHAISISGEIIHDTNNQFIYILNSKDEGSTLNYDTEVPEKRTKKAAIIIGGHILGRGLTVKNLCTSFFIRTQVKSLGDTNLQMCRWFGHKKKDIDLISLYLTQESANLFQEINNADNHLREKFEKSIDNKQPAKCFILELQSTKLFALTSPNKSRHLEKVSKSFAGKDMLSYPRRHEEFEKNDDILKDFLEGKEYDIMHDRAKVYKDINIEEFKSFFQRLKISDAPLYNQTPKKYITFLNEYKNRGLQIPKLNIAIWNYNKIGEGRNENKDRYYTFETPYRVGEEYTFLGHQWVDKDKEFHKENVDRYIGGDDREKEHGILINFNRVNQNYINSYHKKDNKDIVEKGLSLPPVIYYVIHTPKGGPSYEFYKNTKIPPEIIRECEEWKDSQKKHNDN